MKGYEVHVYKAADGWRWRLKARNGRILADSGQAYPHRSKCVYAWWKIRNKAYTAEVIYD